MRKALLWLGLLLALGVPNSLIWQQEQKLGKAVTVYLELAPVDPRSLMQGDYMRLNYKLLGSQTGDDVTLRLDERRVATALEANGTGPRLHLEDGKISGGENFFFEEGKGAHFATAHYAELKLTPEGSAILTGLYDEKLQKL